MVSYISRKKAERTFEYSYLISEPQQFTVESTLVDTARDVHGMDRWQVTIRNATYGRGFTTEYSMGTGHRQWPRNANRIKPTVYDWEHSVPVEPDAKSVLYSIASDYQAAREMPSSTAEALEYLESEFGYEKASDAYRVLEALRRQYDNVHHMLKGTGIDPDHWADEIVNECG